MIKRIRKLNKMAVVHNVALSVDCDGGVYYTNLVQDSRNAYGFNDRRILARRIVYCAKKWGVFVSRPRCQLKPL